ncbi:MAG: HAD-IA family hydrolase [Clostridia bacterium]|nr:HAD-IA family hydrolase [Clostridia bacterium]
MEKCKYILFDLDGTITESHPGITRSVKYALEKHGFEAPDLDALKVFVGPPLGEMFSEIYGVSKEKATEMVATYRERYTTIGKYECNVYDGVCEMLTALRKMGKILCVATSKPESSAHDVLEHFDLLKYFDFIGGDTDKHERKNKTAVINYVMEKMGIEDKNDVIMVGDTHYDVLGAAESGIKCIGVLYGYGDREKLEEAGAYRLAEKPSDITEMFCDEKDILL